MTTSTEPSPGENPPFVVFVQLDVRPECRPQFLDAITENARSSARDEPGCRRFDVCEVADQPNSYLLYEIYDDSSAFEAHRASPHFARWREAAAKYLIDGSQVITASTLLFSGQS